MKAIEIVIFNGVKYRRYANAPYFKPGVADRAKGAVDLHKEIWRAANSEIPAGHDIHHRDGNALNNDLSNLQLMTSAAHQKLHADQRRKSGFYRTPQRLAHMDRIRPMAKAWHASDEGRAWHRVNGEAHIAERLQERTVDCKHCGKSFTFCAIKLAVYCSNACKSADRRASGVDNVERTCEYCGTSFVVNRYRKTRACSKVCGQRLRRSQ